MLKSLQNLHSDQRGSLSLTSMFALIVLVMLLGMIINSGRQVHRKIQLQNAADSATYTGGVVLARGMNALAFSNHLLCDVFALNAFMREGAARRAESLTPEILANWERVGPEFVGSEFPRFDKLGLAINEKVPHESNMVLTWSEWSAAASEMMLPVLDAILEERMIPEYQTSVAYSTPRLAQYAATDIAFRHADRWPTNESASASLWRTNVDGGGPDPIDGAANDFYLTMPVADPVDAAGLLSNSELNEYQDRAIDERFRYSHTYLDQWNDDSLYTFDRYGKMSQFASLWRIFVGGELEQLLNEEYPRDNLPFQIRHRREDVVDWDRHLHDDFMFVGVAYSSKFIDRMKQKSSSYESEYSSDYASESTSQSSSNQRYQSRTRERVPGVFRNPVEADSQAYAQIMLFIPRRRLIRQRIGPGSAAQGGNFGGVPGQVLSFPDPIPLPPSEDAEGDEPLYEVHRQPRSIFPDQWDLMSQNWRVQLAPATSASIPTILSTQPYTTPGGEELVMPDLKALTEEDLQWLSFH